MCDYCKDIGVRESDFQGEDGILYNKINNIYYLVIEHFRGERQRIEINNCPKCGRKLA